MVRSDPPSEDEIKRSAELREWLEERIAELETELARLKDMQSVVDSVLRKTSFVPASELRENTGVPAEAVQPEKPLVEERTQAPATQAGEESRQLRRSKDGMPVANVFITPDKIVIVPSSDVKVSKDIPPFETFFVNRILKGYETNDKELAQAGKLPGNEAFAYSVEEENGSISKITVTNYRDKARLNEILSTVNWAFAKMLEKK